MIFDVILFKQVDNGYIARPTFWPNEVAYGATEQEALDSVRLLIRDLLNRTQFVQVEVDAPLTNHPWLAKAGIFADDPTWDSFQNAMAEYRRQLDDEQAAEST